LCAGYRFIVIDRVCLREVIRASDLLWYCFVPCVIWSDVIGCDTIYPISNIYKSSVACTERISVTTCNHIHFASDPFLKRNCMSKSCLFSVTCTGFLYNNGRCFSMKIAWLEFLIKPWRFSYPLSERFTCFIYLVIIYVLCVLL
jgi:hypothetical protein